MSRYSSFACLALVSGVVALTGCQPHATSSTAADAQPQVEVRPVTITAAPLQVRAVERRISVVGSLRALETIEISAKVPGRVDRLHVDVSDRVKPGDLLVEIDRVDYELAVEEAQRALERELAQVGLTEVPDKSFDPQTLPAVMRANLLVEHAQKEFDRSKSLAAKGAGSVQEYEQALTNLRVEQVSLRQTMLQINATLAAIRHAQTRLATASRQLAEASIVAPQLDRLPMLPSGAELRYAVSQRLTAPGETVSTASGPLLQLVIDDILKLQATVPERYAGEVKLGQKLDVYVDAYPDEVFPATISRISPVADSESRTFEIEALVTNADHRLPSGVFAKASILTRESEEALTVPLEAITSFAGVTKVFALHEGKAHPVPVTLGVRGEGWVEVVGELDATSTVATSGHSQLSDGVSVELREQIATRAAESRGS
jgi:RND family efflux transporter MFP subunit